MNDARRAIVTGAASGIGRATALRLAADGWTVCAVDIDDAGLEKTLAQASEAGGSADAHRVDLSDPESITEGFAAILDHGPPAALVNNAGLGWAATVVDTSDDVWDTTIAVNLTAQFRTCRAVLPAMLVAGGGVIVNVASAAGLVGVRRRAAYCASKAGVLGLTRAIAVDHAADGIRCNAICPGTVASEWIDKILAGADDPEGTRRQMAERQLDGRMGTPEEVAAGIAFLVGPDARFVNGSAFVMDGGLTAI
jgi:NAD(P)-dependent dehydrogenase (short-subunit alcohol dehydrogenase family)